MITVLFLPECPECGCHDVRGEWSKTCFKCGYTFPVREPTTPLIWQAKAGEGV